MKKIFLSITAAGLLATTANAQVIIAPELGLNMANMALKSDGVTASTSMKAGLAVGATVDKSLSDNISFQPGLFFLMNGAKQSSGDVTYNVNSLEIPLNFEYKLGEEGGNRFFFGVGPYVAYNIGGNVKAGGTSTSIKIGSTKPDAQGNGGDDIKALDLGAGINVGYLLANGFFVRAHYQMGFVNLDPIGDSNNSIKTSAIGVTVGYNLGGKSKKSGTKK